MAGIATLLGAVGAACSSTVPAAHPATVAATALVLGPEGARPGGDVSIPRYGVVVFRNATGAPLEIRVEGSAAPCGRCDTAMGFHAEGTTAATDPVPEDGTVSLCFHEVGAFRWEAAGSAGSWSGTVTVGNAR